jgi:hypothetical protein
MIKDSKWFFLIIQAKISLFQESEVDNCFLYEDNCFIYSIFSLESYIFIKKDSNRWFSFLKVLFGIRLG